MSPPLPLPATAVPPVPAGLPPEPLASPPSPMGSPALPAWPEAPPCMAPPVELPPVELPPVELPPVELPPVEAPPLPGSAVPAAPPRLFVPPPLERPLSASSPADVPDEPVSDPIVSEDPLQEAIKKKPRPRAAWRTHGVYHGRCDVHGALQTALAHRFRSSASPRSSSASSTRSEACLAVSRSSSIARGFRYQSSS